MRRFNLNNQMIHKLANGNYGASSGRAYIPGSYADERTAKYVLRFRNTELQALQDSVNPTTGTITFEMLQRLRTAKK